MGSAPDAKRRASEALRRGEAQAAARTLGEPGGALDTAVAAAPPAMAADLAQEGALLRDLAERAIFDDASRVAKFNADRTRKGRKRGR